MIRRVFLGGIGGLAGLATGGCARRAADVVDRWPPLGDFVEIGGRRVHYWERGAGRPVILIHGASGNLRDWTFALAPRLAERYRVIVFDRPGFGYSERIAPEGWRPDRQAAHLRAAAAQLGAKAPVIVGHSWGAALAMAWALDAPDDTRGVVALAGATMPWGGGLSPFYGLVASEITGPPLARLVSATLDEDAIAGFLGDVFAPQPVPDGYAAYIGGPLATRPATLRANARDLVHLDRLLGAQAERYALLQRPVEILHGTADTTVGAGIHAVGMNRLLPQGRLTLLDGVGHMPHHAEPDAVAAAIDRLA